MARMRSRSTAKRRLNFVLWSSTSSTFQPAPMPKRKRPPETLSRLGTSFAVMIGARWVMREMGGPALIVRGAGGGDEGVVGVRVLLGHDRPAGPGRAAAGRDVRVLR